MNKKKWENHCNDFWLPLEEYG